MPPADDASPPDAHAAEPAIPARTTRLDGGVELDALRTMLLIRRFEEKAGQLYGLGEIAGFCHLYIGQEAVVAGLGLAGRPGDTAITAYRNHGHLLAAGVDPAEVLAELMGRASGLSRGKGGSVHMAAPAKGMYGGHGIVGASVPIGAGLAFASRYRGTPGVTWCYIGDCAADQGQVAETFALAARWALPIVFVIENNCGTDGRAGAAGCTRQALAERGAPYGIPGTIVDGMELGAVAAAGCEVAARVRSGGGPEIIEARTERYRGHSVSDPERYADRAGAAARRERDPIEQSKARLVEDGVIDAEGLRQLDRVTRQRVARAAEEAAADALPEARELITCVTAA